MGQNMIVCLEGASAVGKTTTCRTLQERFGTVIIPEVNALYKRPDPEAADWYLERQVDRWGKAQQAAKTHAVAVLDGDPFQPLWYNWSFDFRQRQDLDYLKRFFRPLIAQGTLSFPNRYYLLVISESELRRRKEADIIRSRRNFESHLGLIDTQRRYFEAMASLSPGRARIVEADTVQGTSEQIAQDMLKSPDDAPAMLELFDALVKWLEDNKA